MAIQVVITLSVELQGDDISTGEPNVQMVTLQNSPAQLWQYAIQAGDNYMQLPSAIPSSYLWLDPGVTLSGATWTLRGSTLDVGTPISSSLPSLIPVAQTTPIGGTFSNIIVGQFDPAPQYQVVLSSSLAVQSGVGWF